MCRVGRFFILSRTNMAVSPFFSLQQRVLGPNPAGKWRNNFMTWHSRGSKKKKKEKLMSMYLPAVNIKVSIYIVQGYKKGYRNSTRNCNFANVYLFNNLCKNFLASIAAWRIGRSFAVRCLFPWLCESSLLSLRSLVSSGLVLSPLSSEHSKGYRKFNALFSSFADDVLTVAARTSLSWLVISASIFLNFQLPLNELSLHIR